MRDLPGKLARLVPVLLVAGALHSTQVYAERSPWDPETRSQAQGTLPTPAGQRTANPGTPSTQSNAKGIASALPAPANYSAEPFVIERLVNKIAFENSGTWTAETTARIRVQSQAGVKQWGLLSFPFASGTSTIEIVYVRVLTPDNRVLETPAENIMETPAEITQQAPEYSDVKYKQIAVKGLEPGDTIEYQYRLNTTTPITPGEFFYAYNFIRTAIALQEELQISVPRERFVQVESPTVHASVSETGARRIYDWTTDNLKVKSDSDDASADAGPKASTDNLPSVQITTFRDWNSFGRWFHSLAASQAVATPEIQAKARELTSGAKSDTDKIQAIYNFVSLQFRYIGISLGVGRYQPHSAANVFSNRFGDCKDKHTLFTAMLSAVGVKSYPALMNSSADVDTNMPSPLDFDHVITAIPQGNGFLFLDTTTEVGPFGFLLSALRGKDALVISDKGDGQMVKTPADPPFPSFFHFQANGSLNGEGTFNGKIVMTLRGDDEILYRLGFRQMAQPNWNQFMQTVAGNLGFAGTVSDVTATAPEATDVPFRIEYGYNRKTYGDWANQRMTPPFPPVFIPQAPDEDAKRSPIQLGAPSETIYRADIVMPNNAAPPVPPTVDLHEGFADYHAEYSFHNGVMHFERKLVTKVPKITADQVDAYRAFLKGVEGDISTMIPIFGGGIAPADITGTPEAQKFFQQAQEAIQQRDMPGVIDAYQHAVDSDPKFAMAWFGLGAAHMMMGDSDEGTADIEKAMALDPSQKSRYVSIASGMASHNELDNALRIWKGLATRRLIPAIPTSPLGSPMF